MIEAWVLWVFIVGLVAGGAIIGLLMVRLPRAEDDVDAPERTAEAAWISAVIERGGGVAPASLVEEVLDLHQAYLRDPRRAQLPVAPGSAPWAPPPAPMGPQGGPRLSQSPMGPLQAPLGPPPARQGPPPTLQGPPPAHR